MMIRTKETARGVSRGSRSGNLVVIGVPFSMGDGHRQYKCVVKCDCGNVFAVECRYFFKNGARGGCLSCNPADKPGAESMEPLLSRWGLTEPHGDSHTSLHYVWLSMRKRCTNPKTTGYHRYGGRGISVCGEWDSYQAFKEWSLANGYAKGLELDRRDNDGNYEPDNCRWVTRIVNSNNRSDSHYVVAFGERKTLAEWGRDRRCVVSSGVLRGRLIAGWSAEVAMTTGKGSRRGLTIGAVAG